MNISGDIGFSVLGHTVAYYGLFIALGLIAGGILTWVLCRKLHIVFEDTITLAAAGGLGAIVGAKLLYLMVSLPQINPAHLADPEYLASLMRGGFVFYGGLIGGILLAWCAAKLFRIDLSSHVRPLVPAVALGHGVGRIGCLMVGCCYGTATDGPLSVTYVHSLAAPNGIPLVPVQLIEAVFEIAYAALLAWIALRRPQIQVLPLYLGLYAVLRFMLEFYRGDDAERGLLACLSTSQWISLLILAALLTRLLWRRAHRESHKGNMHE
ncbi:prolipoprotein diacylglyceryl transferase family protein [Collinsella sp. An2]|uniref:prolipoprotein diacylglyceryl transferase n=1 Tax=Collinsella sp. An2 TaxID=1965585 RepID=UPI000B39006F|nr:prolipoprotein diacylglyceryl transferase family protein [Collinsella sp. An2]OUP06267.1 hypothetical protein B5F33_10350 [Collinsella sp. An2]